MLTTSSPSHRRPCQSRLARRWSWRSSRNHSSTSASSVVSSSSPTCCRRLGGCSSSYTSCCTSTCHSSTLSQRSDRSDALNICPNYDANACDDACHATRHGTNDATSGLDECSSSDLERVERSQSRQTKPNQRHPRPSSHLIWSASQ